MADNSTPETSEQHSLSFNDAVTSLLDPPPADNQESAAAEPEEDQAQPSESAEVDTEAEDQTEPETDEVDDDDVIEGEADDVYDEEDASEDEAEIEEDEEPLYTVKVDGKEMEVDLKTLKDGFMMQSAFTKRMQEVAEKSKQADAEIAEARKARDEYGQGLQLAQQYLQSITAQEPDWDRLMQELDAKEYTRAVQNWNDHKANLQSVNDQQVVIQRQQTAERQVAFQEHLVKEKEKMLDAIPAWRDEKTMLDERQQVIEFAKTQGYTPEEIQVASDARAVKALYDSWQLSKLNLQTNAAKKKVRKAPKMAKAGTPRPKGESQTRRKKQLSQRLNKERSINAAVDLYLG
ncbi:MAG TPA: hypothetical protein DCW74_17230 [Alteromonas australica]|uniref:Scaffolding protein n=1 Tax=Alteromonas australica TaxID=589873 RepID=A0A350P847_9ALTE|nr:hypothetical protein [Alteromonas australica]